MSYINYKASPVYEAPNPTNRENVEHAMAQADKSPLKTSKMAAAYAAGREEEGRKEENKVRENIYNDYNSKKEAIRTKFQNECEKINNELKGREQKQALNDLNNKYKKESNRIEVEFSNNCKDLQDRVKEAKDKANTKNESVARSR